jgi:hypothetical protein
MYNIFNKYTLRSAREFLVLFLGLRNMLNWILATPQIFRQTLDNLDEETKKLVLFQFKMEIEAYYKTHHLKQIVEAMELNKILAKEHKEILKYHYLDIVMYPGKKWQIMQFDNIQDFSKVAIPGFCTECDSESPFLYNTDTYVKHIESIISPSPSPVVCGNCSDCGNAFSACARIMTFSHFVSAWA